jgi:predicted secreted hydrolase
MNKTGRSFFSILIAASLLSAGCQPTLAPIADSAGSSEWLATPINNTNFEKANQPRAFSFPADHGAHPTFRTEWWYFTGNLQTDDGSRFGYELTFFRRGLSPQAVKRSSAWSSNEIYMAHFAVTDGKGRQFYNYQRFSRAGDDLAGATVDPLAKIWLEDWSARQLDTSHWQLSASDGNVKIALDLTDLTGAILQGDQGLSRKSKDNASYYYSLPRMQSNGKMTIDGQEFQVDGLSWMDHEFSTSALAPDQVGWDWYAIQLDDRTEVMLYILRKADGSIDLYSGGSLIGPDGKATTLALSDFQLKSTGSWVSPHNQAKYPSGWALSLPSKGIELTITPLIQDQELNLSLVYWEGAVDVRGTVGGKSVAGHGYVELTGYAASMQGQF